MPTPIRPLRIRFIRGYNGAIAMPDAPAEPTTDPVLVNTPETSKPGSGGYVPAPHVPVLVGGIVAVLMTIGGLLQGSPNQKLAAVGAVLLGLGGALGTWFGISSAGPRKLS